MHFKTDLGGHPDPVTAIQVYIVRLRQRRYDKGGTKPIRADTISQHLSAIIQENVLLVDPTVAEHSIWRPGEDRPLPIKHLLRAFARTDPVPNRVWPISVTILRTLLAMSKPKNFSEEHWAAIKDLAVLGFFYLLRPGEYAASDAKAKDHDTLGKPFRLKHAAFLMKNGKYFPAHTLTSRRNKRRNDLELKAVNMAILSFDDQKSTAKGDKACQQYIGGLLCPGTALYNQVYSIADHLGTPTKHPQGANAPLYAYFIPATARKKASWGNVTTKHLTMALRLAAATCENVTGIPPKLINARSLRAGGATALLCAGVGKDITKILGRWRSDAVDLYLRTSTFTLTAGYSKLMVQHGAYKFAPDQVESTLPHSLPEDAPPFIQDEYITQLMLHNDDPDVYVDTQEGVLRPLGVPSSS